MRNVLITGASSGLGLGIARKLSGQHYRTICLARTKSSQLISAIEDAEQAHPNSIHFLPFDLEKIHDIPDLVRKVRKNFGPIYGLINNAGIGSHGPLATMHNSDIERLIRVNMVSPIILTKYVVRHMMSDGGGRIVNIASIVAFTGYSGVSVYGATKASMIGFTRSLAREVGRLGVNVNAVAPGFMETDMTQSLGGEHRDQIIRRSALHRLPEIQDVACAVEFLLGENASSITGTVITVDAGSTA